MEYINTLVATDSVRATPKDIPNKGDLISKGVDFTDKNPTLVIEVPKGGAIVRDIKVPSSNVDEIEVVFTTQYGDEKVVVRGAPTSLPKEQFPQGKVTEIVVKVTKTSDGKAPADVTLSVIACAEGITTGATTQGKTFYNMAVVSRCSNHTVFCSPIRFHIRRSRHNYQGCSRNDDTRSSRHNHKGCPRNDDTAPGTTTKAAPGTTTQGAPGTTTQGAPGTTTKGAPGTTTTGKTCSEMEYINTLVATDSVRATPKDIPNKGDLISKGVDFTDKNPTLVIEVPKGGAIVRDIKVPSSNVDEIEVVFTTQYGDEKVVVRGAPTSLPKEQFPQGKVTEIVVKVTKTSDGKAPADVTLSVIACAEGITTGATTQGKTFYNMAVVSRCSNHTVFCSPIRFHIRRSRHNYQGCSRNDDTRSSRHNHEGCSRNDDTRRSRNDDTRCSRNDDTRSSRTQQAHHKGRSRNDDTRSSRHNHKGSRNDDTRRSRNDDARRSRHNHKGCSRHNDHWQNLQRNGVHQYSGCYRLCSCNTEGHSQQG